MIFSKSSKFKIYFFVSVFSPDNSLIIQMIGDTLNTMME